MPDTLRVFLVEHRHADQRFAALPLTDYALSLQNEAPHRIRGGGRIPDDAPGEWAPPQYRRRRIGYLRHDE
jgi:hypothetical protein